MVNATTSKGGSRVRSAVRGGARLLIIAVILAAGWGVMEWLAATRRMPEPSEAARSPRKVEVAGLRRESTARQWLGFGSAEAEHRAATPTRVSATVVAVPDRIEPGAAVEKGELLVELDGSDFELSLEQAETRVRELEQQLAQLELERRRLEAEVAAQARNLAIAQREFARRKRVVERGAGTSVDLDRAEESLISAELAKLRADEALESIAPRREALRASLASQKAARRQAELNLERTRIVSPLTGIVEAVHVEEGEQAAAGTIVAEVVDLREMVVPVRLPSAARVDVARGDSVEMTSATRPNCVWYGRVARLSPSDAADVRTLIAYVEREQPEGNRRLGRSGQIDLLTPGTFVSARVSTRREQTAWIVPRRAVREDRLMLVTDGEVRFAPVEVFFPLEGARPDWPIDDRQWYAVRPEEAGAFEEGQAFVLDAAMTLREGQAAEPAWLEPPTASGVDPASDGAQASAAGAGGASATAGAETGTAR